MGIFFVIWAVIPLFWFMDPVRVLAEGGVEWFGFGFGHGRRHEGLRGVWGLFF